MIYRKEIDGLRAISILLVMFFHAGYQSFSGGFIGVDIFFVISGYLITTMILHEKKNGDFSLVWFYERRARRLLPALYFVMFFSIPMAWFLLPPSDLKNFGQSLISTSTFTSNFLFMLESSYFDRVSEFKPLLHTWSLAVEEQYYLFFPIFMIWLFRYSYFIKLVFLILLALLSFSYSVYITSISPEVGFFVFQSRIWEILFGSISAFYLYKFGSFENKLASESLSALGMILLFVGVIVIEKDSHYPGFYTLLPTVGTVLVILFSTRNTLVFRFLRLRFLVGLGLISYSLYLWHYPILSFARHFNFGELSNLHTTLLLLISLIPAYFSWQFIEKPFRSKSVFSKRFVISVFCLLTLLFSSIGLLMEINQGYKQRTNFSEELVHSFKMPQHSDCFNLAKLEIEKNWGCYLGEEKEHVDFIFFGDSHTIPLRNEIDKHAAKHKKRVFYAGMSSCIPFLNTYIKNDGLNGNCYELNKKVLKFALEQNVKGIILSARWSGYLQGDYNNLNSKFIARNKKGPYDLDESKLAFKEGLEKTLELYNSYKIDMHIISQAPLQIDNAESIYFRLNKSNKNLEAFSIEEDIFSDLEEPYKTFFLETNLDLSYHDIKNIMCKEQICFIGTKDKSYYHDDDHLSTEGAKKLEPILKEIFDIQSYK